MKNVLSRAAPPAVAIAVGLAFPTDAAAYIDLATGSHLLQLALAGFFASLATLRLYWHRIKLWRASGPGESQQDDPH